MEDKVTQENSKLTHRYQCQILIGKLHCLLLDLFVSCGYEAVVAKSVAAVAGAVCSYAAGNM